ncbi:MAG: helix-turn-helix domain-containing protein [Halapricum sp.]
MSEDIPIDAFERLGLTTYETRVFVALQQLSTGTAREIASVADVPRSQVYDTAAGLAERGLVEEQRAQPRRYAAVDLEEARGLIRERFENAEQAAFEYLESVRQTHTEAAESSADVWTIRGRGNVDTRVHSLVEASSESILYGVPGPDLLDEKTGAALTDASDRGVSVTGLSADEAAVERFDALAGARSLSIPESEITSRQNGRVLIVDDDTVLISIIGCDDDEAAIWSEESGFASVFIRLLRRWLEEIVDL